jgi:hypothetical protein
MRIALAKPRRRTEAHHSSSSCSSSSLLPPWRTATAGALRVLSFLLPSPRGRVRTGGLSECAASGGSHRAAGHVGHVEGLVGWRRRMLACFCDGLLNSASDSTQLRLSRRSQLQPTVLQAQTLTLANLCPGSAKRLSGATANLVDILGPRRVRGLPCLFITLPPTHRFSSLAPLGSPASDLQLTDCPARPEWPPPARHRLGLSPVAIGL